MLKLTKTEKKAYDALLREPGQTLPIDLLIERVYGERRPASAKHGMAAIMRSVIAKTDGWSAKVVRSSELGRGRTAEYRIIPNVQ